VAKLLPTGFIKQVLHPDSLANRVLVENKNGQWRMCVDYKGLNKAMSQRPLPLTSHRSSDRFHIRMQNSMIP
jgi:hypothetical protein